jgi:hypothetical protein
MKAELNNSETLVSAQTRRLAQLFIPVVALVLSNIARLWLPVEPGAASGISGLLLASLIALILSLLIKNPWWWHGFHVSIFPCAAFIQNLSQPSDAVFSGYFWIFMALLFVFAGALVSRVPLYFSGQLQIEALASLIKPEHQTLVDLGAGIGTAIVPLARKFPHLRITAYEIAPLTYGVGRLRTLNLPNVTWKFERFEQANLREVDVVYAFLSTEPMPELWLRISQTLKVGAVFVSNSFSVPDVEPDCILLGETIHPLYVYEHRDGMRN